MSDAFGSCFLCRQADEGGGWRWRIKMGMKVGLEMEVEDGGGDEGG